MHTTIAMVHEPRDEHNASGAAAPVPAADALPDGDIPADQPE